MIEGRAPKKESATGNTLNTNHGRILNNNKVRILLIELMGFTVVNNLVSYQHEK